MKKKIAVLALSFTLLIALTGMAQAQPPTKIIGSWSCYDDDGIVFLVSFNERGVFTATGNIASVSVNHGSWKRTGLNTFSSTDLAFIYGSEGEAEFIQKTNAISTMPDNDNIEAEFEITITSLKEPITYGYTATATCERIQVE